MKKNKSIELNSSTLQLFATGQTFPEANLIETTDLKYPITVDITNTFSEDMNKMVEMMGIARKISVSEGTTLRIYSGYDVTLADGNVPEGEIIPLSEVTRREETSKVINLKKYRKATTGEAIQIYGANEAVNMTDQAIVNKLQREVRTDFIKTLKTGTGTQVAESPGLQGALASAWGNLKVRFEDLGGSRTIAFVNPLDVAGYIGNAGITTQTAFGLTFLEGFVDSTVILTSEVARGEVWATVPENLVLAFINPNNSELARQFNLSGDISGFIGMTHFTHNESLTLQTILVSGILLYPELIDGIVKVEILPEGETPTP